MTSGTHSSSPHIQDTLVFRFYLYIVARFGAEMWYTIISQNINGRSILDLIHEYGDGSFQPLIHVTMQQVKFSYNQILGDFNQYPPRSHTNLTVKYN